MHLAENAPLTLPLIDPEATTTPLHEAVLAALDGGNALFFRGLVRPRRVAWTTTSCWPWCGTSPGPDD